ncbi:hypothetical protein ACYZT7_09300 [Pseudomonas sp. RT4P38]
MDSVLYKNLQGMKLYFITGNLERVSEKEIRYTVWCALWLEFDKFKDAVGSLLPGYFDNYFNTIRPELVGLGYHNGHNIVGESARWIDTNKKLFNLFSNGVNFSDVKLPGIPLNRQYSKPEFSFIGEQLLVKASQSFSVTTGELKIDDLPIIWFEWALKLGGGISQESGVVITADDGQSSLVTLGYAQEEFVQGEYGRMRRDTLYMFGNKLSFGEITRDKILTAR